MPTLVPAWYWVPRCRTMMLPATHSCPPDRLTPSILGFESLPFWVDPPAFLEALRESQGGTEIVWAAGTGSDTSSVHTLRQSGQRGAQETYLRDCITPP